MPVGATCIGDGLFALTVILNQLGAPRLGLAVAVRAAGNAVVRNRIRRTIRESFRLHQHALPAVDIVVSARAGARLASAQVLRGKPGNTVEELRLSNARALAILLIRLYQWIVSPPPGSQVLRFHPSCSYSTRSRLFRALRHAEGRSPCTVRRLSRCHPFNRGDSIRYRAIAHEACGLELTAMANNGFLLSNLESARLPVGGTRADPLLRLPGLAARLRPRDDGCRDAR